LNDSFAHHIEYITHQITKESTQNNQAMKVKYFNISLITIITPENHFPTSQLYNGIAQSSKDDSVGTHVAQGIFSVTVAVPA
jgi:hypothetical protein